VIASSDIHGGNSPKFCALDLDYPMNRAENPDLRVNHREIILLNLGAKVNTFPVKMQAEM